MGRAHEVRAAAMAKTAAMKSKVYSRYGKEIYIAAKSGVADPEMNLALRAKIKEAKSNQVPADVIKRAIEKAKGGGNESYDTLRYEGIGPSGATIIVDCLTDNSNRTIAAMNSCFNKARCKLGVKGSVSFGYDNLGVLSFKYEDEDTMLDTLINAEVDVNDIEVEEGEMTVYVAPADFHKAQDAIDTLIPDCQYSVCAIKMLPQEYVTLSDPHDKELWERLLNLLDEVDDVNEVFHNVEM